MLNNIVVYKDANRETMNITTVRDIWNSLPWRVIKAEKVLELYEKLSSFIAIVRSVSSEHPIGIIWLPGNIDGVRAYNPVTRMEMVVERPTMSDFVSCYKMRVI